MRCIAHYPPELFIISPFKVVRSSTQSCFISVFFTIGILDTTSRGYTSQCHMYMYTLLKLEIVVLLHSVYMSTLVFGLTFPTPWPCMSSARPRPVASDIPANSSLTHARPLSPSSRSIGHRVYILHTLGGCPDTHGGRAVPWGSISAMYP